MSEESVIPASAVAIGGQSSDKPKFILLGLIVLVACAVGSVRLYNQTALQKPLGRVLVADPRNHVVRAKAHFDGWVDTQSVVFDLTDIAGEASQTDVFRVFLQYAKELKDQRYSRIILAAYGQKKFVVPGDYFHQLGQEYDAQNPVYTVRTFSHHVSTLDGMKPFPEPEGGLLWVLGKEMEQFTDLNKRWYLDDFVARHK